MIRRPKLSDIANAVGVSTSAVSLALRGEARVSAETAERIRAEAARVGYIYNKAAAGLRTARSDIVAVCLNDLSNPVFNEFLIHIEEELRSNGRIVFLGVVREDKALQERFFRTAMEQGVGGLLLCPVHGTVAEDLRPILPGSDGRPPLPCALFSRSVAGIPLPQFINDDRAVGEMMAAQLLAAGHDRIHWIGGGQETSTARERFMGLVLGLEKAGAMPPIAHHGPTSRQFGFETALRILRSGETNSAFACFSDLIAFGVLAACQESSVVPGREVSVVGCDDMEEAAFSHPPLSTVHVDKAWIGRSAAQQLLEPRSDACGVMRSSPSFTARATVRPARR
jgi:LacI family transcriptional regulator